MLRKAFQIKLPSCLDNPDSPCPEGTSCGCKEPSMLGFVKMRDRHGSVTLQGVAFYFFTWGIVQPAPAGPRCTWAFGRRGKHCSAVSGTCSWLQHRPSVKRLLDAETNTV